MDDTQKLLFDNIKQLHKKVADIGNNVTTVMVDVAEIKGERKAEGKKAALMGALVGSSLSGALIYFLSLLPASR